MIPGATLKIEVLKDNNEILFFETISRLDTEMDLTYYKNGGILNFVLNNKKALP
ncbi:MAG: hypothetical protein GY707_02490, partial [Desulfobacteraceae bacterium]|nr:hypothetical protein [Desulfobacteraceae bacterium]